MSAQTPAAETALENAALRHVRRLIDQIVALCDSDAEPEAFFPELLTHFVTALAANGGAVWQRTTAGGEFACQAVLNFPSSLHKSEAARRHVRAVAAVGRSNSPQVATASHADDEANNQDSIRLLAPVLAAGQVELVIEILQRRDIHTSALEGQKQFLFSMCEHVASWLARARTRQLERARSQWRAQERFLRLLYRSLDARSTAYTLANETRNLLGCDRVSVAVARGSRCRIEAVSGQDTIDPRGNVVTHLNRLVRLAIASGESLWYRGNSDDLAPELEGALVDYLEQSFVKALVIMPLRRPLTEPERSDLQERDEAYDTETNQGEVIGALVLEQITETLPSRDRIEPQLETIRFHSEQALANAEEYHSLFLMPLWRFLGKLARLFRRKTLPKTLLVIGLLTAVVLAFLLVPTDLTVSAEGVLEPVEQHDVFAKAGGVVDKIHVVSGDFVQRGETLVELRNPQIHALLEEKGGERDSLAKELSEVKALRLRSERLPPVERVRLDGELDRLTSELTYVDQEISVLQEQRDNLVVRSPISGRVVTWDVVQLLEGRPVGEGVVLLTVANVEGQWQLDLEIPEKHMQHVKSARRVTDGGRLEVRYVLQSDPGVERLGRLEELQPVTEVDELQGQVVRARVSIDHDAPQSPILQPMPGTSVIAQVECGSCCLGYQWFHELYETLQRFWFWVF